MSVSESKEPFTVGPDKPLRMRAATLIAIVCAAVCGAVYAQNIRRDVADLGSIVQTLVTEQRAMGHKVDRLEWLQGGRRGPEPDKP